MSVELVQKLSSAWTFGMLPKDTAKMSDHPSRGRAWGWWRHESAPVKILSDDTAGQFPQSAAGLAEVHRAEVRPEGASVSTLVRVDGVPRRIDGGKACQVGVGCWMVRGWASESR